VLDCQLLWRNQADEASASSPSPDPKLRNLESFREELERVGMGLSDAMVPNLFFKFIIQKPRFSDRRSAYDVDGMDFDDLRWKKCVTKDNIVGL